MQVIRLVMLQAALAAGQLSDSGADRTSSMDNALRATSVGEKPAVAMPSNLHTDYSSSDVVSNSPAPTATVGPDASAETTQIPNNPPDQEADLPVGSTGVDDKELEGGSPQALVSDQPVPAPVLSETAPPDTPVQTPEQAASPPTEITGALTFNSPGNPIATTPIIALNQPTSSNNLTPVSNENPAQTPVVTPSPAETTEAAIFAVPDPSSQVSELPPPSASTPDPNLSSPIVSPPITAVTETAVPAAAAAATTFLSVITSSSSSDSAFIALATSPSSSLTPSPSSSLTPSSSSLLSSPSTSTTNSPEMTPNTFSSNDTSNNTTTLNSSDDVSLQPATTYPALSSSNEYLSSQAKVAIALVSVVGVLAVMAVIGYVLWHMRLRDQRLERGRRAAAAAAAAAVAANREFDADEGAGSGFDIARKGGNMRDVGGGGAGADGAVNGSDKEVGTGREGQREDEGGSGPKRTLIRFKEDETKRGLKKEQGVSLEARNVQSEEQHYRNAAETAGNPAAANRSSTLSGRSESSDGSEISTASQKEAAIGYGLGRSESQESEESHYSEGSGDEFRRMETLEGQRARYAHERSESLCSQWSHVEDYYGIERLETEAQQPRDYSADDGRAQALESEETLVRTESNASTSSGRSGNTIGKAV